MPRDLDPATCPREAYFVWEDRPEDAHHVLTGAETVLSSWAVSASARSSADVPAGRAPPAVEDRERRLALAPRGRE